MNIINRLEIKKGLKLKELQRGSLFRFTDSYSPQATALIIDTEPHRRFVWLKDTHCVEGSVHFDNCEVIEMEQVAPLEVRDK